MSSSRAVRPLARGDIVLVMFPFADLSSAKRRPVVILYEDAAQSEFTVVFIGSQNVTNLSAGEISLLLSHPEYSLTGLQLPSKIRATKIATLARSLITRRLGRIGTILTAEIDRALIAVLGIDATPYRDEGTRQERARLATLHGAGGSAAILTDLGLISP